MLKRKTSIALSQFLVPLFLCLTQPIVADDSHAPTANGPSEHSGDSSGRASADISDPKKEKNPDKFFKSFESLKDEKSKNPSFDIGLPGDEPGSLHRCGATVVFNPQVRANPNSSSCSVATAAHCAEKSFGKKVQVKTGYGVISAQVIPNPTYAEDHRNSKETRTTNKDGNTVIHSTEKKFDVAILKVDDKKFCNEVAKVPVCSEKPKPKETVYMGSSWLGELFWGQMDGPEEGIAGAGDWLSSTIHGKANSVPLESSDRRVGGAGVDTSGFSGKGISQGDSGSGMFRANPVSNQLCWAGTLSSTGKKKPAGPPLPHNFFRDASYASDKSLDWVKENLKLPPN
jgi:hypothetical protein